VIERESARLRSYGRRRAIGVSASRSTRPGYTPGGPAAKTSFGSSSAPPTVPPQGSAARMAGTSRPHPAQAGDDALDLARVSESPLTPLRKEGNSATWGEHVSDDEYGAAPPIDD
jgi:hypothetical protein